MKHLPNRASVLLAVAAVFFALGGLASGSSTNPAFQVTSTTKLVPPAVGGLAGDLALLAQCPSGSHVVSGGWSFVGSSNDDVSVSGSTPSKGYRGWLVFFQNHTNDSDFRFRAYAIAMCEY